MSRPAQSMDEASWVPCGCFRDPTGIAGRTNTEEVIGMSTSRSGREGPGHKTLAIRLDDDLHARLSVIAQLEDSTVTDEIRQAIEAHIERKRSEGDLAAKAGAVLEDIEREAKARRSTIAALFGDEPPAPAAGTSTGRRTRPKGDEDSTS
jgi:predicted transcriptional regulator